MAQFLKRLAAIATVTVFSLTAGVYACKTLEAQTSQCQETLNKADAEGFTLIDRRDSPNGSVILAGEKGGMVRVIMLITDADLQDVKDTVLKFPTFANVKIIGKCMREGVTVTLATGDFPMPKPEQGAL